MSVIRVPGVAWVQVEGELDIAGDGFIARALGDAPPAEDLLVLDARGVTFCDVSGVRALTRALEEWAEAGRAASCLLSAPVERVARLLSAEELTDRMEDVTLLPHLAGAGVGRLEPPLEQWEEALTRESRLPAPLEPTPPLAARSAVPMARVELRRCVRHQGPSPALSARQRSAVAHAQLTVAESIRSRRRREAARTTPRSPVVAVPQVRPESPGPRPVLTWALREHSGSQASEERRCPRRKRVG